MRYQLKLVREDVPMATKKKSEVLLRDLLTVMPKLKKHKLDGEILTNIRRLRDGRKQKHYTLELSRKYITYDVASGKITKELRVSAPLTKSVNKIEVLKTLKDNIIGQIQGLRKAGKHPIEIYTFPEGVKVQKLAEVYLEYGTFLKLAEKRVRKNMTKAKVPKDNDKHLGIELEFACKENTDTVCDKLYAVGVGKHVFVKRDGSIKIDDQYPNAIEIAILAKENEYEDVINKICKVINEELHVRVDKSCGLHVHVDMRTRDVAKSFSNLVSMQHIMYAMVPSNRKNSKFSTPVKSKDFKPTDNHYEGVSAYPYNRQKTIELRMHCGTSQSKKINNWIKLIVAIADAPLIVKSPTSIASAKELLSINDEMVTYVESRIAKFEKQHKKEKASVDFLEKVDAVATMADDASVEEQSEVA